MHEKKITDDLWQAPLEHPFPGLNTHAFLCNSLSTTGKYLTHNYVPMD